jgi:hypothetical protein
MLRPARGGGRLAVLLSVMLGGCGPPAALQDDWHRVLATRIALENCQRQKTACTQERATALAAEQTLDAHRAATSP